jgi:hypothetical protein
LLFCISINKKEYEKQIDAVKQFHAAFNLGFHDAPVADLGEKETFVTIQFNERRKTKNSEAVQNNDLVEIADALGI